MGTHALIKLCVSKPSEGGRLFRTWAAIYIQLDGYPEGVGLELFGFLSGMKFVNGIPFGLNEKGERVYPSKIANGVGDLFAQIVAHFKTEVGGTYLADPNDDEYKEEWNYDITIYDDDGKQKIVVAFGQYDGDFLFEGSAEDAVAFINKRNGDSDSDVDDLADEIDPKEPVLII